MPSIVKAQRLTKRQPIYDQKGVMIDDGANHPIILSSSLPAKLLEAFAANVRKNVGDTDWKIWIEKSS